MSEQRLSPGDTAPDFTLPDADGKDVSLADFRGQSVVVYFYPAELNNAGYQILGISPDKPEKLAKFVDAEALTFPLLSDPEKTVLKQWGAFGEKKNYGKVVQGVIRSTFVVDPEGKISTAQYNVRATGHVAKLIKDLNLVF